MQDEQYETDIEHDMHEAIAGVLKKHSGGWPIKWIAVVETIEQDGARGINSYMSPDARPYEMLGHLQYASQVINATVIAAAIRAED